jgi:hypothetical protein
MTTATILRSRRPAGRWILPALALACLAASPADAARVRQVRVGDHADFTRIVLELDGPADYRVSQKSVGGVGELVIGLDASTAQRVIGSSSRVVENVTLRPGPGGQGAEARVTLRVGAVDVKEMVLEGPDRIVLDLSPAAAAPAPKPAPAPTARPEPPAAETRAPAAETRAKATETAAKAAETRVASTQTRAATTEARAPSAEEVARLAAAAAEQEEKKAAAEEAEVPPARDADHAEEKKPAAAARTETPRVRTPKPAPAPAAEPDLIARLGGGDPTLGLSVAIGGVALLLAAFLLLRRRSQRIAQEAAAAPWPPPGAEERPEFSGGDAEETEEEEEDAGPLFASSPTSGLPRAPLDAEPEVAAKPDASPAVEELERRLERLEARLADSLDARERLERQLAAHTEELRVQRAAIARTQRAVRAAVRGPEGGEQPAGQKVPSQVPKPEAPAGGDEG